jgi:transposase
MDLDEPRKGVLVGRRYPYPEEFRNDAVALFRAAGGRRTYAADVGVTGETLRSWVRQADEQAGVPTVARRRRRAGTRNWPNCGPS